MKLYGFLIVLREKFGVPEAWQWYMLDAHQQPEDFVKVTGGVPVGFITRGKRKGKPQFSGTGETFFVRMSEVRAAEAKMKGM